MNEYLDSYNAISQDVKFISNSIIRLKVLKALYEKPSNMKELSVDTKLGYSSISGILHGLELKKLVYRKANKYYLVNLLKLQIKNILEFSITVNLLEKFFNIVEGHLVCGIPKKSVEAMHFLKNLNCLNRIALILIRHLILLMTLWPVQMVCDAYCRFIMKTSIQG